MALTLANHQTMLRGFAHRRFIATEQPTHDQVNPLSLDVHYHDRVAQFRLWTFAITHGGGGPTVRAADEFRIQVTNGPTTRSQFDTDGRSDLLIGYHLETDTIVAYDRRWLERWTDNKERTGKGGSPSVQVKHADISAGREKGVHHLNKAADFGTGNVVTMHPHYFPLFLLNHELVLNGTTTATTLDASHESSVETVAHYCAAQRFPFPADLLARYVASLIAKPFVILAGVSGTGKSKLPQLVAEFYSLTTTSARPSPPSDFLTPTAAPRFVFHAATGADRFALVPVRPDWTDNQAVLGFVNPITNEYASTHALDLILRAKAASDSSPPFFMLLDEMNLARVEHYFSDWLACMESRRLLPSGRITQEGVPLHRSENPLHTSVDVPNSESTPFEVPPTLEIPLNVVVTGTVNVDETTYGFSPKVLDRAMVLEFDDVDLHRLRSGPATAEDPTHGYRFPRRLPPFQLATRKHFAQLPEAVHDRLVNINGVLNEARLHFGYRTANEIGLFMTTFHEFLPRDEADPNDSKGVNWNRALDAAVLQKVLPRLSGNRAKLEGALATLAAFLRDGVLPTSSVASSEYDADEKALLSRSYRRTVEMLHTLRDFGFVTFFK